MSVDDIAYCWAVVNDRGQVELANTPAVLWGGVAFRSITATAEDHQCGVLMSNASVVCWGRNDQGQLGNGTTAPASLPLPVAPPPKP